MIILGIETSCDETGVALVEKTSESFRIIENVVASSLTLHAKTGGIIPETAAREQLRYMLPVIEKATKKTGWNKIDAIAITIGPGLIGSLLVGVETAKTLAYVLKKPLIPVNHLYGHIYANWLHLPYLSSRGRLDDRGDLISKEIASSFSIPRNVKIEFPALALVVSGGHTDLVIMQNHETLEVIGGTRDDAAGEAFDKIGRLLGFPYPAGPVIAKLSEKGDPKSFRLPRPMIGSGDFDFSFSGLKTAVLRETKNNKQLSDVISRRSREISRGSLAEARDDKVLADFCASVQYATVDVLVKKTIKAAKQYKVKSILLGGGVAANESLRNQMELNAKRYELDAKIFAPAKNLCTDNAAMIAAAGFFAKAVPWQNITADPELYY